MIVNYIIKNLNKFSNINDLAKSAREFDYENFKKGLYIGKPCYFEDPKYLKKGQSSEELSIYLVNRILKWAKSKGLEVLNQEVGDTKNSGFHFVYKTKDKRGNEKTIYEPDYIGFSSWAEKNLNFIFFKTGELALYKNKFYKRQSKIELEQLIKKLTKKLVAPKNIMHFITELRAIDWKEYTPPPPGLINLKNGILNAYNRKLTPHSKDYHFLSCFDYDYDSDARCPLWDRFLNKIFNGDVELIELLHQVFGYILEGGDPYLHKAFIFYGSGRNGKSTVLRVLSSLLSDQSVSYTSLESLDDIFSRYSLAFSLVNINEEISSKDLNSSIFKNIVAGGMITVSKKFMDEFAIKSQCRFIFCANEFPRFIDSASAIIRRLVFIPFNYNLKDDEIDPYIADKLIQERSGILNRCLDSLTRLKTYGLIQPKKSIEVKDEYREETDLIYSFITDVCEYDEHYKISTAKLYSVFLDWCRSEGRFAISKISFIRKFLQQCKIHPKTKMYNIEKDRNRDERQIKGIITNFKSDIF